ncbi:hypothetical protein B0H10DRAFT_2039887 [Mycena sp. CBHHK59/15]|nr:hypothetical protein B0H10DRAFT_2039887 [Mycena sp. CBHHK59/15]
MADTACLCIVFSLYIFSLQPMSKRLLVSWKLFGLGTCQQEVSDDADMDDSTHCSLRPEIVLRAAVSAGSSPPACLVSPLSNSCTHRGFDPPPPPHSPRPPRGISALRALLGPVPDNRIRLLPLPVVSLHISAVGVVSASLQTDLCAWCGRISLAGLDPNICAFRDEDA